MSFCISFSLRPSLLLQSANSAPHFQKVSSNSFFSYLRSFICLTSIFFFNFYFCVKTTSFLDASVQFGSVAQSCLTLCDPMNHSTPVHHQLPEFTQTHVHRPSDAIQPSHPLLSPSPSAPNPSQHQGLFQ